MLVRAGQESSDRTEPVPPERESLTPEERPKAYAGNSFNSFTNYGVGIGLRVPPYQHILAKKPVVDSFRANLDDLLAAVRADGT